MLTVAGICCLGAKKNILHIYRGCRVGCSPFLGSPLTLPCCCNCPQCLWNLCTYLPDGSRRSYFFYLFSRVKVGLKPSFMLEFCLIAMSLHLSSKTLMLLSLPNPWKACWRWFFTNFQDFIPKSAGISPFFMWEDLLLGLIVAKKPSLLVTRRTEVSNRTFRTLGWLFQQPYEQIKLIIISQDTICRPVKNQESSGRHSQRGIKTPL